MPRCLHCSANEEVRLNKWKNNYVCLKLHLLCTAESWHAFQLSATGRQTGKSTRSHHGTVVPENTWLIRIWLSLPEWIWITRFDFLLFPDDSEICSKWVDTGGTAHFWIFQKHSDIEKHCVNEWSVSRFRLTTLLMTITGWVEVPPGRTPGPVPHRCPMGLHFLLVTWGELSEWLLRSLLILRAGRSNKWFVFLNKTKQNKNGLQIVCGGRLQIKRD